MPAIVFWGTVGNRRPHLRVHLRDDEDQPLNLGASDTVKFSMSPVGAGTAVVVLGAATIEDLNHADGTIVAYAWAAGDVDAAGDFEGQFIVTWAADLTTTNFPRPEPIKIRLRESA